MFHNSTNSTLYPETFLENSTTTTNSPTAPTFTRPTASVSSYCCPNSNLTFDNFNFSTEYNTEEALGINPTEPVHKLQINLRGKIWSRDEYGSFVPYEQYTTPTSILFFNFFLVIFLMIVIGIAVYPAVKKYCDSTFYGSGSSNRRYWIEDNEEVVAVLTSNIPQCSFPLLNSSSRNMASDVGDSSSICSLERLA